MAIEQTAVERLRRFSHHDPFEVLGKHDDGDDEVVRALVPDVETVVIEDRHVMSRRDGFLFEWRGERGVVPARYRLTSRDRDGQTRTWLDPYCFPPQLDDAELARFGEGRHYRAHRLLGARAHLIDDIEGVLVAVWAPNAERVSVVGDFNHWDGRRHIMRSRGGSGIWELFLPELEPQGCYKFEIRHREGGAIVLKNDPYARSFELRPRSSSMFAVEPPFKWHDHAWIEARSDAAWLATPLSIYEVHLGSWCRSRDASSPFLNYRELAHRLVDHVRRLGFTHIELLPLMEHPLDASWGYQTTGYFAPTSRYGSAHDFCYLVDYCHANGIGVLADWTPAHFPRDAHALACFDGTALYEHDDPRLGEHPDWDTLVFDYGRKEVRSFLLSSALYWLEAFHLDGLRVDAVASMLYLDYSRDEGEWVANEHGGNENLAAVSFLRELNTITHQERPGTVIIAEESTAWPQVTRPTWLGGLGFSMKWNMGWMNDTLRYFEAEPVHRRYHHDQLTFGMLYGFSENFVLALSHDEVVHEKRSLFAKMPGDDWRRFANLRLLYTYMWTHPGKKLLFMGGEHAEVAEWNFEAGLDWELADKPMHVGISTLIADLNRLYREEPALHRHDFDPEGFAWIDCHDADQSVISFLRFAGGEHLAVVLNFTPVPRHGYRIGLPAGGWYEEVLNSDASIYGGSDCGNGGRVNVDATPFMGRMFSAQLTLPPLGGLILRPKSGG